MTRSLLHCPMCGQFVIIATTSLDSLQCWCENRVCVAYNVRYTPQGLTIGAVLREYGEPEE